MNNLNLNITLTGSLSNTSFELTPVDVKGVTSINMLLTSIPETDSRVTSVAINWGDGSETSTHTREVFFNYKVNSIFDEVLLGKLGGSLTTAYNHVFANTSSSYGIQLSAQVFLNWENGWYTRIVQPLNIYWGSFYDDVQDLRILNTQIVAVSSNNTFINFESVYDKATLIGVIQNDS